jgi:hypothetical protein
VWEKQFFQSYQSFKPSQPGRGAPHVTHWVKQLENYNRHCRSAQHQILGLVCKEPVLSAVNHRAGVSKLLNNSEEYIRPEYADFDNRMKDMIIQIPVAIFCTHSSANLSHRRRSFVLSLMSDIQRQDNLCKLLSEGHPDLTRFRRLLLKIIRDTIIGLEDYNFPGASSTEVDENLSLTQLSLPEEIVDDDEVELASHIKSVRNTALIAKRRIAALAKALQTLNITAPIPNADFTEGSPSKEAQVQGLPNPVVAVLQELFRVIFSHCQLQLLTTYVALDCGDNGSFGSEAS